MVKTVNFILSLTTVLKKNAMRKMDAVGCPSFSSTHGVAR